MWCCLRDSRRDAPTLSFYSKGHCKHKLEDKDHEKQLISSTLSSCKNCVVLTILFPNSVSLKAAAACQQSTAFSSNAPWECGRPETPRALATASHPTLRSHPHSSCTPRASRALLLMKELDTKKETKQTQKQTKQQQKNNHGRNKTLMTKLTHLLPKPSSSLRVKLKTELRSPISVVQF